MSRPPLTSFTARASSAYLRKDRNQLVDLHQRQGNTLERIKPLYPSQDRRDLAKIDKESRISQLSEIQDIGNQDRNCRLRNEHR